jgi:hypothetical protein
MKTEFCVEKRRKKKSVKLVLFIHIDLMWQNNPFDKLNSIQ